MPVRRVTVVAAAATIALTALAGTALASSLTDGAPSAPAAGLASETSPVVVLPPTPTSTPTAAPTSTPSTPDDSATPSPSPLPDGAPPAPGRQLTADEAGRLAVAIVGGGVVREIESEHEHGRLEWEVDVRFDGVEHDLDIDAATGEVTDHDTDRDDDGDGDDDRDDRDDRGDRDDDRWDD